MDALFGLPRKKSAGTSVRLPLFGHTMFMNQNSVDEYVAAESTTNLHVPKVCVYAWLHALINETCTHACSIVGM